MGCAMIGCLLASGVPMRAHATGTTATTATRLDDATPRDYDIAQGPLGTVLGRFASQSGLLLSYDAELTRGHTAAALKGRYTVLEGAQRLLRGSGLQLLPSSPGTYVLVPQGAEPKAALELTPTVVGATGLDEQDTYRAPGPRCASRGRTWIASARCRWVTRSRAWRVCRWVTAATAVRWT